MTADFRNIALPAWILLPASAASILSTLVAWGTGSLWLGLATAFVAAISVTWWCERTLHDVIAAIAQIAGGDRYAALPRRIGSGALAAGGAAAEAMRQALVDADALTVD